MIADVQTGRPFTPTVRLLDANGSPLSGAPSPAAPLTVYGPASLATPVAGPTNASDQGDGYYGIALAGSVLALAGQYTFTIPSITVGGITFAGQGGAFTVGDIPPEYRTLRGILVAVCQALGVGVLSASTAGGSTTTLRDSRWQDAGLATNEFVGAEIVILEPGAATDPNPVRVTASDPATGILTFTPPLAGATASGTDYILMRATRRGLRYAELREAVDLAIADLARTQTVTDQLTLTTKMNTYGYGLPANWLEVKNVEICRSIQTDNEDERWWEEIPPAFWDYYADRRKIALKHLFGFGYRLRLTGKVAIQPPRTLGSVVRVPWMAVRDWAVGSLGLGDAQRAGMTVQRAQRAGRV